MSISGGIKFFEKSKCLMVDGASIVASTGQDGADSAIDRNPSSYWRSVGSTDLITETLEVTFPSTITLSRFFLVDHNFKQFTIKYDVSGVWTHFTSVVGIDGALISGISETTFSEDTAYYEFTPVVSSKILISVLKTQTENAQKYISQIIATAELATLQGYPIVDTMIHDKNASTQKVLSGKILTQKSTESFSVKLNFQTYPPDTSYHADVDLMFTLFDSDDNFMIWLCGGRRGSTYFKYALRGFRLKDVYTVQVSDVFQPNYSQNVYINSINLAVSFGEAV